jgi:hypothetical protein
MKPLFVLLSVAEYGMIEVRFCDVFSALRLDKLDKKQVVSSHEGTKGTKVFLGSALPDKRQTNALMH